MALGYWHNIGQQRRRIVVMPYSYHGDTIGAMSVGARGIFNAAYRPLLFDVVSIPFPARSRERDTLNMLYSVCQNEHPAAFIVEPHIVGAGGMLMYPAWVLREMKRICEAFDVLFIADEVMTGWGRTGTLFACEQTDVTRDIARYSKGLTGGALPLAVTLCGVDIFDAHHSEDRMRTFFHSSSFTANPVACAAAKANLELWLDQQSHRRLASVAEMQEQAILPFREDGRFANVRRTGAITALDLKTSDTGYLADIGPKLQAFFSEQKLLLRPLGNTIYVMPPFCITAADLDEIYAAIRNAADALT